MEEVKSIKDYAASRGVSYENVRKQVLRYEKELKDHITKTGKTRFLDSEAMQFLDGKRTPKTIAVVESVLEEETRLAELEKENKELKELVSMQKDEIIILYKGVEQKTAEFLRILNEKEEENRELQRKLLEIAMKQDEQPVHEEEAEHDQEEAEAGPEGEPEQKEEPEAVEEVADQEESKGEEVPEEEPEAPSEPREAVLLSADPVQEEPKQEEKTVPEEPKRKKYFWQFWKH